MDNRDCQVRAIVSKLLSEKAKRPVVPMGFAMSDKKRFGNVFVRFSDVDGSDNAFKVSNSHLLRPCAAYGFLGIRICNYDGKHFCAWLGHREVNQRPFGRHG